MTSIITGCSNKPSHHGWLPRIFLCFCWKLNGDCILLSGFSLFKDQSNNLLQTTFSLLVQLLLSKNWLPKTKCWFHLMQIKSFFLILVASFSGLYCSITHLYDCQCQPASLMNIQLFFICFLSMSFRPYPGVDHLIEYI